MVEMGVADQVALDVVLQNMTDDAVGRTLRHLDIPEDALLLSGLQPVDQSARIARDRVAIPVRPDEIGTEIAVLDAPEAPRTITSKPSSDRAAAGVRSIERQTSDAASLMRVPFGETCGKVRNRFKARARPMCVKRWSGAFGGRAWGSPSTGRLKARPAPRLHLRSPVGGRRSRDVAGSTPNGVAEMPSRRSGGRLPAGGGDHRGGCAPARPRLPRAPAGSSGPSLVAEHPLQHRIVAMVEPLTGMRHLQAGLVLHRLSGNGLTDASPQAPFRRGRRLDQVRRGWPFASGGPRRRPGRASASHSADPAHCSPGA